MTRPEPPDETDASGPDMRRRRLSGPARRASILEAAARVFERTGDLGSTTTKMIAHEAGVNEAMLYRYFDSKDEIFYAAVVEPLRLPMAKFASQMNPPTRRMTRDERLEFMSTVMHGIVVEFSDRLAALGLVIFGNPATAGEFYQTAWEPALRDLAAGWKKIFDDVGLKHYNDTYLSAQAVIGTCLAMAMSKRHGGPQSEQDLKREREQCAELARMMYDGVFAYGAD
ncbi:hypothetical protein GCM10022234_23120 [Aeromicrobium panaciterrae]|uniref:TetR/AcrR family transcriptional regulator n=1 Tax=Aeromicrobium panaciterrae TaxID=363861 RepID=UPI0031D42CE2